jgi:hypothetical protein
MKTKALCVVLFVSFAMPICAYGASDSPYEIRVGAAPTCPGEPKSRVAGIPLAILTSMVSQAVSSLVDLVGDELTKDGGTKLLAQAPVNALLTGGPDEMNLRRKLRVVDRCCEGVRRRQANRRYKSDRPVH